MGMYVCEPCIKEHSLETASYTTVGGFCEVCRKPGGFLTWCPELTRQFMFEESGKVPSVEEQLAELKLLKAIETDEQKNNPTRCIDCS